MRSESDRPTVSGRRRYTVVAEPIGPDEWHVTVRELPDTWTVAFGREELERRARQRIALDLACDPAQVDIQLVEVPSSRR